MREVRKGDWQVRDAGCLTGILPAERVGLGGSFLRRRDKAGDPSKPVSRGNRVHAHKNSCFNRIFSKMPLL